MNSTPETTKTVSTPPAATMRPPEQSAGGSVVVPASKTNGDDKQPKKTKKQLREAKAVPQSKHHKNTRKALFFSALEWKKQPFKSQPGEEDFIVGSPKNVICWPYGKHFILAPEKSLKTTFAKRFFAGMACGITLFPQLPVNPRKHKILYSHGELSLPELQERTLSALADLPETEDGGLDGLIEGRCGGHLIDQHGQQVLEDCLKEIEPDIWVIDPWQEFIKGANENSGEDIGKAQKFIDKMINEYGLTVFIPMHEGKDHSKGARGWSGLSGWRNTLITLTPHRPKTGKDKGKLLGAWVTVEPRWAKPPKKFYIKLQNGTVRVVVSEEEAVIAYLKSKSDGLASAADLIAEAPRFKDRTPKQALSLLNRLFKQGVLAADEGHHGKDCPKLFSLAPLVPDTDTDAAPPDPEDDDPSGLDEALTGVEHDTDDAAGEAATD